MDGTQKKGVRTPWTPPPLDPRLLQLCDRTDTPPKLTRDKSIYNKLLSAVLYYIPLHQDHQTEGRVIRRDLRMAHYAAPNFTRTFSLWIHNLHIKVIYYWLWLFYPCGAHQPTHWLTHHWCANGWDRFPEQNRFPILQNDDSHQWEGPNCEEAVHILLTTTLNSRIRVILVHHPPFMISSIRSAYRASAILFEGKVNDTFCKGRFFIGPDPGGRGPFPPRATPA